MKAQYTATNSSYSLFRRDKDILAALYDEMVDRFRDPQLAGEKSDGKPTLREAFELAGWNYNAARKFRQRHENEKNQLPVYESSPKPLQLTAGDLIKDEDGIEGVASHVHEKAGKVDFTYRCGGQTVTETRPVHDADGEPLFAKVKPAIKKIKLGDLILCEDNGAEYQYAGGGKFSRTQTPTLLQQKRVADDKREADKKARLAAKKAETTKQKEIRKTEAARRDLEKIAAKEQERIRAKENKEAKAQATAEREAKRKQAKADKKAAAKASKAAKKSLPAPVPGAADASVDELTALTPHGFYGVFVKTDKFGTPWHVMHDGDKKPIARLGNKQDCANEVAQQERKALAAKAGQ